METEYTEKKERACHKHLLSKKELMELIVLTVKEVFLAEMELMQKMLTMELLTLIRVIKPMKLLLLS